MGQRRASLNLPVELLEHVLAQPELSFRDVLRCKRVCVHTCPSSVATHFQLEDDS